MKSHRKLGNRVSPEEYQLLLRLVRLRKRKPDQHPPHPKIKLGDHIADKVARFTYFTNT